MSTSPDPKDHPCLCGPSKVIAGDGTICMFKEPGKLRLYKQIVFAFENRQLRSDIRISRLYRVVVDKDCDVLQRYVEAPPEELAIWNRDGISGSDVPTDMDPSLLERMVGILLIYIENRGTLYDIVSFSECTEEQRYCWAAEIEGLVEELHTADVVWGDAKPQNVLVDLENRLWLIDFDGSYTPGWVDEDKKETQEGDLQGLNRIKEWLIRGCKKPTV
ncbi:kinase-like domain protein [Rutstroemia sp. NJR-2017a BVV2]|nr:kinase-like domain protein [Rutstroemia sp. NJR-2017a BVV2]